MKLAAVLVPAALLVLPTFLGAAMVIGHALRGDYDYGTRPVTVSRARKFRLLALLYFVAFLASIGWAVYVFTHTLLHLLLFALCVAALAVPSTIAYRSAAKLPKPPVDGFPDDRARLEWENKRQDALTKHNLKMILSWKWWAAMVFFTCVFMTIGFIITAIASD